MYRCDVVTRGEMWCSDKRSKTSHSPTSPNSGPATKGDAPTSHVAPATKSDAATSPNVAPATKSDAAISPNEGCPCHEQPPNLAFATKRDAPKSPHAAPATHTIQRVTQIAWNNQETGGVACHEMWEVSDVARCDVICYVRCAWCEWCNMWDVSDVGDAWCEMLVMWCDVWCEWNLMWDARCDVSDVVVLKLRNSEVSKLNFLW